jgi:hypothetical protein
MQPWQQAELEAQLRTHHKRPISKLVKRFARQYLVDAATVQQNAASTEIERRPEETP